MSPTLVHGIEICKSIGIALLGAFIASSSQIKFLAVHCVLKGEQEPRASVALSQDSREPANVSQDKRLSRRLRFLHLAASREALLVQQKSHVLLLGNSYLLSSELICSSKALKLLEGFGLGNCVPVFKSGSVSSAKSILQACSRCAGDTFKSLTRWRNPLSKWPVSSDHPCRSHS